MMTVRQAAEAIESAVATVDGIRLYELGDRVDPPAVIVGMPQLRWEALCDGPSDARFPVYIIVPFNDRARNKLWDLVAPVSTAIDENTDGAVVSANPAPFTAGGTDLPSYELTVEVALT